MEPHETERRNQLVIEHLGLVRPAAVRLRRCLPPQYLLDDLIQIGRIGLIQAASAWRSDHKAPFPAFARHRIRGAMLDHIRATYPKLRRETQCEEIPLTPATIASFDIHGDAERAEMAALLDRSVPELPPAQRKVITLRRTGLTQAAVAKHLGVKPESVAASEHRGVANLKKALTPPQEKAA